MNYIVLKFVYLYTVIYDIIEDMIIYARKYEYVDLFMNKCNDIMIKTNARFYNLNVEPNVPYIEVSYISNNKVIENINTDYKRHRVLRYFENTVKDTDLNSKKILFTHKFKDNENREYIQSKIIDRNDEDIKKYLNNGKETLCDVLTHIKNSTDTNQNSIMGIEYSHPKMENNITLNIDNKYFVRNNDILDSIFILKYLRRNYRESEIIFDKDYKVSLMDANINFYELGYNDYLHFSRDNDKWIIKKIIKS